MDASTVRVDNWWANSPMTELHLVQWDDSFHIFEAASSKKHGTTFDLTISARNDVLTKFQ